MEKNEIHTFLSKTQDSTDTELNKAESAIFPEEEVKLSEIFFSEKYLRELKSYFHDIIWNFLSEIKTTASVIETNLDYLNITPDEEDLNNLKIKTRNKIHLVARFAEEAIKYKKNNPGWFLETEKISRKLGFLNRKKGKKFRLNWVEKVCWKDNLKTILAFLEKENGTITTKKIHLTIPTTEWDKIIETISSSNTVSNRSDYKKEA